jgi:hypothetical protein
MVFGRGAWSGCVELAYTLPQISPLFVLMQEQNIDDVWRKKLD